MVNLHAHCKTVYVDSDHKHEGHFICEQTFEEEKIHFALLHNIERFLKSRIRETDADSSTDIFSFISIKPLKSAKKC